MSKEIYIRIRFFKASSTNFNTSFVKFVSGYVLKISSIQFLQSSTESSDSEALAFSDYGHKNSFFIFLFFATKVWLISSISWSSPAIQKTGTTLTPKLSSFSFASCKIEITL